MRRREFITLFGGVAAAWPLSTHAQQGERVRHVGVLMNIAEHDPQSKVGVSAFESGLTDLGWTLGSNLQIEYRWGAGDANRYRKYAPELVALSDVIMVVGGTAVGAVQQTSRTVPIVFVAVTDPVSRGLVASLARPGGRYHRIYRIRIQHVCEMAGAAQTACAERNASSRHSGSHRILGDRPVGRHSERGAVIRDGDKRGRRARYQRDRACDK